MGMNDRLVQTGQKIPGVVDLNNVAIQAKADASKPPEVTAKVVSKL